MSITKTREVFSLPNVHYALNLVVSKNIINNVPTYFATKKLHTNEILVCS